MKYPIVVLSFNRPELLTRVLDSLRAQTSLGDDSRVHMFQDGGSAKEAECISAFNNAFPGGRIHLSDKNLGIALNFDRAEKFIFQSLRSECGFFFEDDLVLEKYYLDALEQLASFALNEPRVAYFAAYGDHRAAESEQRARSHEIVRMSHKWGFGITRSHWERQQPIVEKYLEIIRHRPYMERDAVAIRRLFADLGYSSAGTSQDAAKDIACHVVGATKVMSFACFAKYEGREGMHTRSDFYDRNGWGETKIIEDLAPRLVMPTSDVLDSWVESDRYLARINVKSENLKLTDGCSRTDVMNAYRFILGRQPESEAVIEGRIGGSIEHLRRSLLLSSEFSEKYKLLVK